MDKERMVEMFTEMYMTGLQAHVLAAGDSIVRVCVFLRVSV